MKLIRFTVFLFIVLVGLAPFAQKAEAYTSFGFSAGYHHHGHYPYYGHGYYGHGYYGYRPYWGFGFGYWGWPSYGYGYGWPYYGYSYAPYYGYDYYSGEIRTEVKPQNASVYVNGDYVGVADNYDGWWQKLTLPPGKYRLTFRAPGFTPYVVTLQVFPGQNYHIKQDLQPGEDVIAEQDMRLPPEEERQSRRYSDRYNRPPQDRYGDRYENEDRDRDDYYQEPPDRNWEEDRQQQQQQQNYGAPPAEHRSTLTIQVTPPDASVYVDGMYYGTAGQNNGQIQALLGEGVHRLEAVRPGFESYSQDITVNPGAPNQVTIQLQKK